MKILAIIPARGGSKGVPGKNIKLLGDKPLIVHAIDCAKESKMISSIVVTTDSVEIINVVEKENISIITRPDNLAKDDSPVVNAVKHALDVLKTDFDLLVLLQPTAPLRSGQQLDEIIDMFKKDAALEGVISVVPMDDIHPARMYNLDDHNNLIPYIDSGESLRRQDLAPVYYRNGCFYVITQKAFLEQNTLMPQYKKPYVMDPNWLVNIDNKRDFALATLLYDDWKDENSNN
ncbi:acylneuraminate cytidylyltransferase family protein [Flavobacterium sp. LC2016-01]|uniref:acylneuraminate cytidylyltransferase family protein n=1 Tax=Flavobacterium sp. LC2016-01 TaxID=2675876 RepID=UPI0012BAA482|nr:acylneuraminate cytidylyltransferase family protein [Flavobacterium sp. LC2016-01]MTH17548.1 acylneuraminate cytidylyltransferase family protein [Flavobacterium sp. LC2016-01]